MPEPSHKVLIIDDEQIIRDGLRDFIDWEAEGFTLVGAARDAEEALALVGRFQPELIITDISMPDCDGLELAARVKELLPRTVVVLLSGYSEFGYAQRAIELGIFRYLSKPIREDQLKELLADARAAICRGDGDGGRRSRLIVELAAHKEFFQDSFFSELRRGSVSERDLDEARLSLDFPLPGRRYVVAVMIVEPAWGDATRGGPIGKQSDMLLLRTIAAETLRARGIACGAFQVGEERIALLCSFPEGGDSDAVEALQAAIQELQLKSAREIGVAFSTGVAEPFDALSRVPECFAQAQRALGYRLAAGRGSLILWADIAERERRPPFPVAGSVESLVQGVRAADRALMESAISRSFAALEEAGGCDDHTVQVFASGLIHAVAGLVLEMGYALDDVFGPSSNPYRDLCLCGALPDVRACVTRLCSTAMEFLARRASSAQQLLAQRAKKYIDDRFCDAELSLPRIARGLQASQAYVSHVFKTVLGVNLSEYLARCRIEYAKQLLKTSSLRIFEIAEECGFRDTGYFSTLFKRLIGVAPSDYREKANFDIP